MMASTPRHAKGLQRDFGCEVGSLANFQEWAMGANFAVLREVTAGLAHHPYGDAGESFAMAGAEKEILAIYRLTVNGGRCV